MDEGNRNIYALFYWETSLKETMRRCEDGDGRIITEAILGKQIVKL
jgi:hypothetical protein